MIQIWQFTTETDCGLQNMAKLTYHTQPCNAVSWSSDGTRLATSGDDKMIAVWDPDERYDPSREQPGFGETMVFPEKWHPTNKIRGPLAEVSDIEWLHDDKTLIVSSLDGNIGFYHIKKQQHLHTISLNTQFIQGLSMDHTFNLLAVQTTAASAKVYRIIKQRMSSKNRERRYRAVTFATLSHYPYSAAELEQQQKYNQQYKEEKKELEELQEKEALTQSSNGNPDNKESKDDNTNNTNDKETTKKEKEEKKEMEVTADNNSNTNTNTNNTSGSAMAVDEDDSNTTSNADSNLITTSNTESNPNLDPKPTQKPKPKAKPKKKRIPKCSLFKHNLITTSRKPHWSRDGLLLCMVAGVSKDKSNDCIHIFHRSNLTKKVTTIILPESTHATVARFHPLKLQLPEEGAMTGSIAGKYKMSYRMLLAVICGSELFVFDTAKTQAVFYWKDQDTQNFFDMEWTHDGKALIISDVEGFLTRVSIADEDLKVVA